MLHIKLTMMLLFLNITLVAFVPNMVIGDNELFTTNADGQYTVDGEFSGAFGDTVNGEGGLPKTSTFGITDVITLLWDIITLMFSLFFASFYVMMYLYNVGNFFALILGVPLVISYGLAIAGWIK